MTKKIPKLRFAGFNGEWEENTFDDIFDLSIVNNSLSRANLTYNETKIKNIHYGDIHTKFDNILDSNNIDLPYLIDDDIKKFEDKYLNNGDVIFADAAEDYTVGKCVELNKTDESYVVAGLHTIVSRPKKIIGKYYLGYYLNSYMYRKQLFPLLQGIKVLSLSKKSLSETNVIIPKSIGEQEKIGELFETLDACLEDQAAYVETLKKSKKSFLQKLFPQKGAKAPELRFPGFEGDWELKSLSAYFSIPEPIKLDVTDTKQIITVRLKLRGIVQNENDNLKLGATQYYKRKKGQFIYGKQNLFNGAFGIIPENLDGCVSSGDIPAFDIINMDANFIYYFFSRESFYKRLENISSGSGSKRVHEKELLNVKLNLPSLLEQEKIGAFFKDLDEKIEKEEDKLESFERLKSALLQKVFV